MRLKSGSSLPIQAIQKMNAGQQIDFNFENYNSHNIFNRLSDSSEYGFYFFPYGYLFRYPKWGTINNLGFRTPHDLADLLKHRDEYFLVQFFGGSTGFDILVPDHETIASRIESFMNKNLDRLGIQKQVIVLNLSQPGNVLLNHISNFTLYGFKLRPDMIISHHGFNDVVSGLISDHRLLKELDITYPDITESWSRFLHQTTHPINLDHGDESSPRFRPVDFASFPNLVVKSFVERVSQFCAYSCSIDAFFLSGLQPALYSKQRHSPLEETYISNYKTYYKKIYSAVEYSFDLASEHLSSRSDCGVLVDIHSKFKQLSPDTTHFGDTCHLLSEGNEVVAEAYNQEIVRLLDR